MKYIPAKGDVVWIDFDPTKGHEQKGRRPAVVISPDKYNKITSRAICCPVTSKIKNYVFEVPFEGKKIKGAILTDQIRTMDFSERNVVFVERVPRNIFVVVEDRIKALLFE
ncbi:MAG: type II toxin-antitoxin system PemK/MazF family toxin [Candidatus Pacebacteria bacterium]|nr:type II toxin-antitoxin system PemK/MazF family toxin [Candidatus Paceibacterota bacterium]